MEQVVHRRLPERGANAVNGCERLGSGSLSREQLRLYACEEKLAIAFRAVITEAEHRDHPLRRDLIRVAKAMQELQRKAIEKATRR